MENIVEIRNVDKSFGEIQVLKDFSLNVKVGSFTTISGASGCGKSTLLNMVGLLDKPDTGEIIFFGKLKIQPFSRQANTVLRTKIGYLFQNYALIDEKSVEQNLEIALEYVKHPDPKVAIANALDIVGLYGFEKKKVFQCSGGEQQRIAIARLLLKPCALVLADEPTGSLDEANKHLVVKLLKVLQSRGKTILMVTHDPEIIAISDENVSMD